MENIVTNQPLISIEKEMQDSYLDYAMSVIVSRAIPDVTDGLKPVHRRIIYAMKESNCDWNKPYRKSARIVGEVMGKYHPHGDSAIYDALVRMAQGFSLRLPLIDGQGNFGSMDGDKAAAMRYTESRLKKVSHSLIDDIDKDTVDFQENYDGSEKEPVILPAKFPNILVNGAGGIAVGMATNIPPHNLGEVITATCTYIDNPDVTDEELLEIVPGPDFPTGGTILGRSGSRKALLTGRGSVIMRANTHVEDIGNRKAIVITEIPYQVNKSVLCQKIGELVREKKLEGISEMRDESDKNGVRVVIELKRDATPEVVLSRLYSFTQLQTSFGVNMLALDRGKPRLMSLREVIKAFVRFREEVITRRTLFLLNKSRDKAHILIGLSIAVANIDEIIRIIRNSPDPATAKEKLLEIAWPAGDIQSLIDLVSDTRNEVVDGKCYFTDEQARAILEMRLSRLTGLESDKINTELKELSAEIKKYLEILHSRDLLLSIMKDELTQIKEEFATPRRSQFDESEFEADIEDLIQKEDMVVTVTMEGYIKRVPLSTYRAQKRGGKGRSGASMKDEDVIIKVFVTNTHTPMLFFSTTGKVYKTKVYKLPIGTPQSKGRALVNIFPLEKEDTINVVMPLPDESEDYSKLNIMLATRNGNVRRNPLTDFERVQSNGKIAIKLDEGDSLVGAKVCQDEDHILLAANGGKAIRFPANAVRQFKSRTSSGVRGIKLADKDYLVSMSVINGIEMLDTEVRAKYLKIATETRIEIANLIKEKNILEIENSSEAEQIKDKISNVINSLDTELSADEIIKYAVSEDFILTLTENGYGKRTSAYEYRITNRGGQGIQNIVTSERNGKVISSFEVEENDQVMLITDAGKLIRCPIQDIRIGGRNTQGVTIFKSDGDKVVSTARIIDTGASEESEEEENA